MIIVFALFFLTTIVACIAFLFGFVEIGRILPFAALLSLIAYYIATAHHGVWYRRIGMLFGILLVVCNLGESIAQVLGLAELPEDPVVRIVYLEGEGYRELAQVVGALAVCGYLFGACLTNTCQFRRINRHGHSSNIRLEAEFTQFNWFLCAGALWMVVFMYESWRTNLFNVGYRELVATRILLTAGQLSLSSIVILAALARTWRHLLVVGIYATVVMVATGIIGWRGHSSAFVVAAIVIVSGRFRIIRLWILAVGYCVAALGWGIVGAVREQPFEDRDYVRAAKQVLSDPRTLRTPIAMLYSQELSLRYGVRFADEFGHLFGQSYLASFTYAVPNVLGPARAREGVGEESVSAAVSAAYVRTYGIGFTPAAEAYVNFGLLGAFCILALVGAGLTYVDARINEAPYGAGLVFYGLTCAGVLWWSRNDSMQLVRFVAWGYCYYICICWIVRAWPRKASMLRYRPAPQDGGSARYAKVKRDFQ